MRVIAGVARGRRLLVPSGLETRPTSDRVKESLFSILGDRVPGAVVLDLYAGSGALAIEALSRGAERAILVEDDRRAVDAINDNLEAVGFTTTVDIQHTQVRPALHDLANAGTLFDLIFLDPPYTIDLAALAEILRLAVGRLTKQGLAILEHRAKQQQPDLGGSIVVIDSRRYGNTGLSFFGRSNQ